MQENSIVDLVLTDEEGITTKYKLRATNCGKLDTSIHVLIAVIIHKGNKVQISNTHPHTYTNTHLKFLKSQFHKTKYNYDPSKLGGTT